MDDETRARLALIRERHVKTTWPSGSQCGGCAQDWECDAVVLLAAHDAQAAQLREAQTAGQVDPDTDRDMAAIRRRAPFAYGQWRSDLLFLLETLDVQAQRLAAIRWSEKLEAEHRALTARLAAAEAERDGAVRGISDTMRRLNVAEQRATRLAALEQTVREYRTHRDYRALDALFAALAALDAPSGRQPPEPPEQQHQARDKQQLDPGERPVRPDGP